MFLAKHGRQFSPKLCILSSSSNIAVKWERRRKRRAGSVVKRDLQQKHHVIETSVMHLSEGNRIHSNVTKITG